MKYFKTAVLWVLAAALCTVLTACGSGSSSSAEKKEEAESTESAESSEEDSASEELSSVISEAIQSAAGGDSSEEEKPLELVDSGWYRHNSSGDTEYVDFCGLIHNPNETLVAQFPKVRVTVKGGDGSILSSEEQTGSIIMPGDTVILCGMFSVPASDLTEEAQFLFDVDCSEFSSGTFIHEGARTTDFEITNTSERTADYNSTVTGEITSHYTEELDTVNLSYVMRKEGTIVYMQNTFLDNVKPEKTTAFEINSFDNWPEHDSIEFCAMSW